MIESVTSASLNLPKRAASEAADAPPFSYALASASLEASAGAALKAGCDLALCCNYSLADKVGTAKSVGPLEGTAKERAESALALLKPAKPGDPAEGYQRLAALIKPALA